jgi:hypothetical protein
MIVNLRSQIFVRGSETRRACGCLVPASAVDTHGASIPPTSRRDKTVVTKVGDRFQCDQTGKLFDSLLELNARRRTCDGGSATTRGTAGGARKGERDGDRQRRGGSQCSPPCSSLCSPPRPAASVAVENAARACRTQVSGAACGAAAGRRLPVSAAPGRSSRTSCAFCAATASAAAPPRRCAAPAGATRAGSACARAPTWRSSTR